MEPIELGERLGRWPAGRGPLHVLLAARLRRLIDEGELPTDTLVRFIAGHKARSGVEPICPVLSQHGCPGGFFASLKGLSVDLWGLITGLGLVSLSGWNYR
jgi:hypothetical protein